VKRASPPSAPFSERLVAHADDIDELGHVSNIVYVRWIQEIAKAHSRAVGWDHGAYLRAGAVFVVRRHELDYLGPVLEGDRLRLDTFVASWSAATSERRTTITREVDGREVARALTTWAFVSIATGRPTRIPEALPEAFALSVPPEIV
jgi:acyl-CoA thioester hydrolase